MIEKGWNYYKNLTTWHVRRKVSLSSFSGMGFATSWEHWDLCFLGVKRGSGGKASQIVSVQKLVEFQTIYRSRFLPVIVRRLVRVVRNPSLIATMLVRLRSR